MATKTTLFQSKDVHKKINAASKASDYVVLPFDLVVNGPDDRRVDKALDGRDWLAGDYSVADAVLFYVEFWADKTEIPLPAQILRHYRAMLARPAVSLVLREEGYRPETLGQRAQV